VLLLISQGTQLYKCMLQRNYYCLNIRMCYRGKRGTSSSLTSWQLVTKMHLRLSSPEMQSVYMSHIALQYRGLCHQPSDFPGSVCVVFLTVIAVLKILRKYMLHLFRTCHSYIICHSKYKRGLCFNEYKTLQLFLILSIYCILQPPPPLPPPPPPPPPLKLPMV
jgi:hypothetical protein